jgi:Ser/Thr protein kinase RdoA (MazF antagonist)
MSSTLETTVENPTDEELRKLLIPDPSVEQILDVIRKSFLLKNDDYDSSEQQDKATISADIQVIRELDSYDDKNLWISINGTHFLVKVHNGVESQDLIEKLHDNTNSSYKASAIHLQNAMMMHLNQHGISTNQPQQSSLNDSTVRHLPTPGVIHSLPVVSKDHSPRPLVVRLLGFVPGRPMQSFPMLPLEALANAGTFLGRLSTCLSKLSTDELLAAKRYHQWDGKNTLDLRDFTHYINDDRKRNMVESVLDAFQTDLTDSKVAETSFSTGLIHGDFNDANFLLDDNFCVSGVIDFGDSVER